VIVCFSAGNLERIAEHFPRAVVAADNDLSAVGEETAKRTGLPWTMPYEVGTDFNDLMMNMGLHVVVERMRELLQRPLPQ
jgi:putative DNA primase/helicase